MFKKLIGLCGKSKQEKQKEVYRKLIKEELIDSLPELILRPFSDVLDARINPRLELLKTEIQLHLRESLEDKVLAIVRRDMMQMSERVVMNALSDFELRLMREVMPAIASNEIRKHLYKLNRKTVPSTEKKPSTPKPKKKPTPKKTKK